MWQYDFVKQRFRAIHAGGRVLEVEQDGPRWSLWYRRTTPPPRSLLVGRYRTPEEAKSAAADLVRSLSACYRRPI
jgi:hypothetical protein